MHRLRQKKFWEREQAMQMLMTSHKLPELIVEEMTVEDRDVAAQVLADAFADYSLSKWICGSSSTKPFLQWQFLRYAACVQETVKGSQVLCAKLKPVSADCENSRAIIVGVAIVLPPASGESKDYLGYKDSSNFDLARYGFWQLPAGRWGRGTYTRSMQVLERLGEAEDIIAVYLKRFWYLDYLAVDPRLQSRGLGGAFLEQVIAGLTQAPVVINTYAPRARPLYESHGFKHIGCQLAGTRTWWYVRGALQVPRPEHFPGYNRIFVQ